jgi:hypothetical protein
VAKCEEGSNETNRCGTRRGIRCEGRLKEVHVHEEQTSRSSSRSLSPEVAACSAALVRGFCATAAAISLSKGEGVMVGERATERCRSRWPKMISASLGISNAPNLTVDSTSCVTCRSIY